MTGTDELAMAGAGGSGCGRRGGESDSLIWGSLGMVPRATWCPQRAMIAFLFIRTTLATMWMADGKTDKVG